MRGSAVLHSRAMLTGPNIAQRPHMIRNSGWKTTTGSWSPWPCAVTACAYTTPATSLIHAWRLSTVLC